MRIGLIAPPWIPVPPPAYGGTESVIDNLARGLRERGHDVTLFTVGESTCGVRRRHLFAEAVRPMGRTVPETAHLLAAYDALAGDVDVIHDHTLLGPLLAARAGLAHLPIVTTHHGLFTSESRRILREVARQAAVVAISDDQASRAGDVPITAVIHHGIDLDAYRPGPGDGDHLVFVGRMSPEKGVAQAVRIAHGAGRPLRIVAKAREAEELEYFHTQVEPLLSREEDEVAELGLAERLRLLRHAAGLLNPIAWPEPFGLAMVESMAAGTPVLARPAGAAPEIVTCGRTGFLFDTDRDGVDAVERLPEIDRAECRRDVERRFSLQRMAADHERLYEAVVTAPRLVTRRLPLRPTPGPAVSPAQASR